MYPDLADFFAEHPFAKTTQANYTRTLRLLADDYPDPAILTAPLLKQWLEAHATWHDAQRWNAYCAIRSYLRWRTGGDHPALRLKLKRPAPIPQRYLSIEQAIQLLDSFDPETPKGIRDLAIAATLLDTGLRESEICQMQVNQLDRNSGLANVLCKGGKWQHALLSPIALQHVAAWLAIRPELARPGVPEIFVALGGNKPGCALTANGLRVIVRRWGETLGIQLCPHDFRRSFAMISVEGGAPTRLVQIAGRWQSIQMVEYYTRGLQLKEFSKYAPMGIIKK